MKERTDWKDAISAPRLCRHRIVGALGQLSLLWLRLSGQFLRLDGWGFSFRHRVGERLASVSNASGAWCLSRRALGLYASVVAIVFFSTACGKPDYPSAKPPSLQATISADGMMVATLDRSDQASPRLTVFDFNFHDGIEAWELPAPPFTNSIRFGLQGYELLLTHLIGDRSVSDLLQWNLAEPQRPPEHIYRSVALNFPLEVKPGVILVRDCKSPEDEPGICKRWGVDWTLVTRNGVVDAAFVSRVGRSWQSWPSYVSGEGVFWANPRAHRTSPSFPPTEQPMFVKAGLLGGVEPNTSHLELFGDETRDFACDFGSRRCLRVFIANWGQKGPGPYRYDVDVFLDGERCVIDGERWSYIANRSMTPDGRAAVLTVADEYAGPRRVVVLRFDEGQCEPTESVTIFDQRSQE